MVDATRDLDTKRIAATNYTRVLVDVGATIYAGSMVALITAASSTAEPEAVAMAYADRGTSDRIVLGIATDTVEVAGVGVYIDVDTQVAKLQLGDSGSSTALNSISTTAGSPLVERRPGQLVFALDSTRVVTSVDAATVPCGTIYKVDEEDRAFVWVRFSGTTFTAST